MLQPFVLLEKIHLHRLIAMKRNYLVSQTYARGYHHLEEVHTTDILVTDYDNRGQASMHLNAVKHDPYAAIIDLSKPAHLQKINSMMAGDTYQMYWAVIANTTELKNRLNSAYKLKLRRYVEKNTNWRIASGESLNCQFEISFGELFLIIRWKTHRVKLTFGEIERY
ncbi:MAG: hypothetical protein JST81_03495 [Bacteroidetes bacterium]|nr:hypothetical protein [Bacteroidota bacterium]